MKHHTRTSEFPELVTFNIWNNVLPTITNRKTPNNTGPILLSYYFF